MRYNSMSYELGVMMFNAFKPEYTDVERSSYNIQENCISLIDSVRDEIRMDSMKSGYVTEGEYYNLDTEWLEKEFEKDYREI